MRWLLAAIACAVLAEMPTARAADPPTERVVVRFSRGTSAEEARFADAVRAELAGVAAIDGVAPEALVVIRVTWEPHTVRLDFEDAAGSRLAPSRSVSGEGADVVASQAASIIRATAIALREAAAHQDPPRPPTPPSDAPVPAGPPSALVLSPPDTAAMQVAPAPAPQEAPSPKPVQPVPLLALGASYAGALYAPQVPWRSGVRVEASATAARWSATWLFAGVRYGFDPSVTVATPGVDITTARHTAAVRAGIARSVGVVRLGAEVGPLVSWTLRSATSTGEGVGTTADHVVTSFGVAARALAALVLGRSHIEASAGLSAFPSGEAYVVQSAAGEKSVFAPNRVQPEASVGVGYDLW